ncbi:hypothetical protein [Streptomyces sp. NRRL S-455]|uniref:hypothetical protein n=1 Tax=Streptomyces sp. NRRL S-455 TaxID=1463908 RepID=UPI0004C03F99|nr:hypothetical protein [Streptomyces sp. NRRL S-455]
MSDDTDRKLLGMLDSLSPDHVQRLKTLTDARTATPPASPTDGPETYRGVTVPETLRPNWDQPEAHFWRAGVSSTLDVAVPLVDDFIDPGACSLDHHGYCQEHGWFGENDCPNERAQEFIKSAEAGQ